MKKQQEENKPMSSVTKNQLERLLKIRENAIKKLTILRLLKGREN